MEDEQMLAELINDGVVYVSGENNSEGFVSLFVICNDTFWWGTADGEDFAQEDIKDLYEAKTKPFGITIWCCKHRKLQPQIPLKELMQKNGVWTEELEALPASPI